MLGIWAPGCISSKPTFAGLRKNKKKENKGSKKRVPEKVPGAAERQKTLAGRADGRLRAGPRGAGEAAFAGSVQTLQALCGDCHSEKTLRESAQPTSLESRHRRHGVRPEPQAASSSF